MSQTAGSADEHRRWHASAADRTSALLNSDACLVLHQRICGTPYTQATMGVMRTFHVQYLIEDIEEDIQPYDGIGVLASYGSMILVYLNLPYHKIIVFVVVLQQCTSPLQK